MVERVLVNYAYYGLGIAAIIMAFVRKPKVLGTVLMAWTGISVVIFVISAFSELRHNNI